MAAKTGVTFGDYHSYTAFGLRLKKVEIGFPEVKTKYIEVPGLSGCLDLTESLYGGVTYGMRTLSFTFDARNCNYPAWETLISTISACLHGQKVRIIQDTDPDYYYEGRCEISTSKSNEALASVVIECYCSPYKVSLASGEKSL